jgi:hypothetical protein
VSHACSFFSALFEYVVLLAFVLKKTKKIASSDAAEASGRTPSNRYIFLFQLS